MSENSNQTTSDNLSAAGRKLLNQIVQHFAKSGFSPGDPRTYPGYKKCCVALGLAPEQADLPWGRLLQRYGLNDFNEWTMRHDLPRVSGLIVNQMGERQYWPVVDYFASKGRPDMDVPWWEEQASKAAVFDWTHFI